MNNKKKGSAKDKKRKPARTKKTSDKSTMDSRLKNEIKGIVYLVVAILFFVSQKYEDGIVFKYLVNFLKIAAGKGYVFVPWFLALIGMLYFANLIKEKNNRNIFFAVAIFISNICLMTVWDKNIIASGIFDSGKIAQIAVAAEYFVKSGLDDVSRGGGIIGGVISYLMVILFGITGSKVIFIALIVISLILILNKSVFVTMEKILKTLLKVIKNIGVSVYEFIFIEEDKANKKKEKKEEKKEARASRKKETSKNTSKKEYDNNYSYKDYNYKHEADMKKVMDLGIDEVEVKQLDFSNEIGGEFKTAEKTEMSKKPRKSRTTKPAKSLPVDDESVEKMDSGTEDIEGKYNDSLESGAAQGVEYKLPPLEFLMENRRENIKNEKQEAIESADILLNTLNNFGIDCKLVQINRGPTITRYELQPAPGVKVSKITNLSKDIALSLATSDLRIEAPIPGKAAIGIEVPNSNKSNVFLKELIDSAEYRERENDKSIPFTVGKDIAGKNVIADITSMPHLLIAGATGSGKSVCINSLLISILYNAKPNDVKLILVDPKVVELNVYNGIPHLLIPVVTDPRKAANALNWAVQEMTNRYELFAKNSVRDINSYNAKMEKENENDKIPKIVIIIDELADLMMVAAGEVEDSITRLAQLARAAGIHLVIATQRPSVDVITGTIKANIPSRIAFAVSSHIDSRTILDVGGAEKLLGKGDLLYHPVGMSKPQRIQGTFVSDDEVKDVIEFIKNQSIISSMEKIEEEINNVQLDKDKDYDELIQNAAELVVIEGQASVSYLQRKLKLGYSRAARIVDQLEEMGIVGPHEGSKPRKVLINAEELEEINF
ncbi:DNA translocase FtsK [Dethiosulfatibacter aminovorans DSM 17477]|uniref:DNA translocase FtsK n=1 Tax=Dethiosulfatibacter aminovorans DSM 17477 TaxID=1121476 RepID=A0A1M6DCM0_9FIRM|nr:DNA translocase FtsK [Dethiosulfatibacter aminovorans]SHI71024.1 DNA translocase FtsK [Dethiosulfatibacter aminovorans DSM 17477]